MHRGIIFFFDKCKDNIKNVIEALILVNIISEKSNTFRK